MTNQHCSNRGGKRPGAGRKKGIPNALTTSVKEAIAEAFDELGGVDYLVKLGRDDPKIFCTLLGKIIPAIDISPTFNTQINNVELSDLELARRLANIIETGAMEQDLIEVQNRTDPKLLTDETTLTQPLEPDTHSPG